VLRVGGSASEEPKPGWLHVAHLHCTRLQCSPGHCLWQKINFVFTKAGQPSSSLYVWFRSWKTTSAKENKRNRHTIEEKWELLVFSRLETK
jgi:murein endopeptidase